MFPKKKSVICIGLIISLQTAAYIKCMDPQNETGRLQMQMKNTFNYDVAEQDVAGRVLIWEVTSDPDKLELHDYSQRFGTFTTDRTYLLVAKKSFNKTMVHYWIGTNAPLKDKIMVAKYAVTLFTLIHQYYNIEQSTIMFGFSLPPNIVFISREQESLVSEAFQHTINLLAGMPQVSDAHAQNRQYVDTQFLSNLPNLYVVRGNNNFVSIKKVPILNGLKWLLRNNTCLVLENIYNVIELLPINILCGSEASSLRVKLVAWKLGLAFDRIYITPGKASHILEIKNRSSKWKKMLEVLEDSDMYKFYELDPSDDHLKDTDEFTHDRPKTMSIHKISKQALLKQVPSTPINSGIFDNKDCYILDTDSVAGLFFIIGEITNVEKRVAAAERMEYYMHNSFSSSPIPIPMRITADINPDENKVLIDLLINFADWPPELDNLELEDEEWGFEEDNLEE